jgi:hypothetical protein
MHAQARRAGAVVLAASLVITLAGCPSSNSESPHDGGAGGSGGGAAGTGGSSGDAGGCPTAYDLPHYAGDTTGLCDPAESTLCSCTEFGAALSSECTPDGSTCVLWPDFCTDYSNTSFAVECGWNAVPAACPALGNAVNNPDDTSHATPCASDADCVPGHYCAIRVANRMFCDDAVFHYADEYCTDAGTDGGDGAAGSAGAAGDGG